MDKDLGFHLSKCCRASFRVAMAEGGVWKLYCGKCGKCCAVLKEFKIKNFDIFV